MWLWLSILLALPQQSPLTRDIPVPGILAVACAPAYAEDTSSGPTSPSEAELLWKDGKNAFEEERYTDAINALQRLVDRYPGYEGYLEAHRYLGRALMLNGKTNDAVAPLKQYIAATGTRELGLRARLWLGEDYLLLSKPSEAYLTAGEIEGPARKSSPEIYAESQFLKARALIALKQDDRATEVLDSAESAPAVQSDSLLKGHAARIRLELKLRRCAKYPSPGTMDEGQARDQFGRRALCLQEALILFKDAAESREAATGEGAVQRLFEAFSEYEKAAEHPPTNATARTAAQKKQYRLELADLLEQDSRKSLHDTLDTLTQWKNKAADGKALKAQRSYSSLIQKIEGLLGQKTGEQK